MEQNEIKNEIVNKVHSTWYEGNKGKVLLLLSVVFVLTAWSRFVLALILLPLIYSIKKGNRTSIVLAGIYSGFLTIVNMAVYVENNRNAQGNFDVSEASPWPVFIYIVLYILLLVFAVKTYKNSKRLTISK